MEGKWFTGIRNFKDLQKKYVALSKKHHPDLGGDTEIMQEINAEHKMFCELLKSGAIKTEPDRELRVDLDFVALKFARATRINSVRLRDYQIKFLNEILDRFAEGHTSISFSRLLLRRR